MSVGQGEETGPADNGTLLPASWENPFCYLNRSAGHPKNDHAQPLHCSFFFSLNDNLSFLGFKGYLPKELVFLMSLFRWKPAQEALGRAEER